MKWIKNLSTIVLSFILVMILSVTAFAFTEITDPNELLCSESLLEMFNRYLEDNEKLQVSQEKGASVVFLIEGAGNGGNNTYELDNHSKRDQALCAVVKNYEVVYVDRECTTLASGDPSIRTIQRYYNGGKAAGVASIIDGIYEMRTCTHKTYPAFNLQLNRGAKIPCVRYLDGYFQVCDVEGGYDLAATGINLHTRDSIYDKASDGCQIVGVASRFEKFMAAAKSGNYTITNNYTYVVVDRTLAEEGLEVLYPGAVHLLTGSSNLKVTLGRFGSVDIGCEKSIPGHINSKYIITNVSVEILSDGEAVQSDSIEPNSNSVNLSDETLFENIHFEDLAEGRYTLRITAEDDHDGADSVERSFLVHTDFVSDLDIDLTEITSHKTGNSYNISGTVSSDYLISQVTGEILSDNEIVQTVTVYPEEYTFNVETSAINYNLKFGTLTDGNYTLVLYAVDETGTEKTVSYDFVVKLSELQVNIDSIGKIAKGVDNKISGTITSDSNIRTIKTQIFCGSVTMREYTQYVNTKNYNVLTGGINNNVKLSSLPVGEYTLKITVKDDSGNTIIAQQNFSVWQPESELAVVIDPIGALDKGSTYKFTGSVSSNYNLKTVCAQIYSGSSVKAGYTIYTSEMSLDFDGNALSKNINFQNLAKGEYFLRITATDSYGKKVVVDEPFSIVIPPSTLSVDIEEIGLINKGENYILNGIVSSNYSLKTVQAKVLLNGVVKVNTTLWTSAYTLNIGTSYLNNNIGFRNLGAGEYLLQIIATDSSGEVVTSDIPFTVWIEPSALSIDLDEIGTVTKGEKHSISGNVTSNYSLKTVCAQILLGNSVRNSSTIYTSAKTFDIASSNLGNYLYFQNLAIGNYTLKIIATDTSGTQIVSENPFTVEITPSTLTVMIEDLGILNKGAPHTLKGTVSSNYKLKTIQAQILQGNVTKLNTTLWTSANTVSLETSSLKNNLAFQNLAYGDYTIRITATDTSGAQYVVEDDFTVELAPSELCVALDEFDTTAFGKSYALTGIITSNHRITKVNAQIISNGTVKQSYTQSVSTYSYSVRYSGIDNNMRFAGLAKGDYTLKVTALDESGKEVCQEIYFTVK